MLARSIGPRSICSTTSASAIIGVRRQRLITIGLPLKSFAALLMRGLSLITYGCLRVLLYYTATASPRAEYLADEEMARVSSPHIAISGLDKLCLGRPFMFRLRAAGKRHEPDVWQALVQESQTFPPRGHERLRRIGRRSQHKADDTHPLTAYGIDSLRRFPESPPLVVVSAREVEAIEHELSPIRGKLAAIVTAPGRMTPEAAGLSGASQP